MTFLQESLASASLSTGTAFVGNKVQNYERCLRKVKAPKKASGLRTKLRCTLTVLVPQSEEKLLILPIVMGLEQSLDQN